MALAAIAVPAQTQELPRIAVYVTGDFPDNEKSALGTLMLASLVNSGRYRGIERSQSFLAEIDKEQLKQRSGAIDDSQISALGRQFGVKFVCIAAITPAFGSYQVSARIVDVETAEVISIGQSFSPLKTPDDLARVSSEVVKIMFGAQPQPSSAYATQSQQQQNVEGSDLEMRDRVRADVLREEQIELERKRLKNERWRAKREKVKIGANVGYGLVVFNGDIGEDVRVPTPWGIFDVGIASVFIINKNMLFAPQFNTRWPYAESRDDASYKAFGVSIPLLVQFSTNYRVSSSGINRALFVETGIGFDWLATEVGFTDAPTIAINTFNGKLLLGVGVAFGRTVYMDIARLNFGTAYFSINLIGVRAVF